jgi:hypothetical protein
MGRFSPTVAPVANDGLANALGNFTESYMQFSARKRQLDRDAIETGVGLTPVDPNNPNPTSPPSGPLAALRARLTGRTNPNDIATAVQNAAPAVEGANAVNAGIAENLSRSSDGSPPAGSGGFVASRPTGGGNYATNEAVPGGSFPDLPQQMRLPSGQIVPLMMTPMGQRMMAARLAALGMGSEIRLRNSEIEKNRREASRPQLGDPNFAQATAEVEGAKAQATLGPELQKLVAQGAISRETALMVQRAQAGSAAALQGNQQTFTAGENVKNRGAEAERQTAAKGEELSNKLTEIRETQKGQVLPTLIRGVKGAFTGGRVDVPGVTRPLGSKESAPATAAPSGDVKTQRADWDTAAAHARQQGKDPDELLGPRP